ncbi:MAG: CPBP family intramembrane metalloprotease [Promethearchaeota archaeon]|nr:MAG: CPBP family intramembrane metalloprotease [Candidatus Lokiarchaeota archaeon]
MGFSTSFWIFLGLSCLEFIFLIGPAIYFKKVRKESIYESLISKSFPSKRSYLSRLGDIGAGIAAGVFLNLIALGVLYTTFYSIVGLFGEDFYNVANTGSIDVSPNAVSIGEAICTILIYFVIVGVCEEYFFRSVLFIELKKVLKNWSYIINGVVFALFHVFPGIVPIQTTVTYFFYYFIIGILFCILLDSQNSDLLSNIIAHGVFNSIPLVLFLIG